MKRKAISRRLVLKGIGGAALALPVLESFGRGRAFAQSQDLDLTYAVFFRQACGVGCAQSSPISGSEPERFWPTATGPLTADTMNGRAVDELLDHRERLLIVGNVNMFEFPYGDGHARGAMQGLTARGPTQSNAGGDSEAAGESIDHRIGAELNPEGRESLVMYAGRDGGWLGGPCISYRAAGQRRAAYQNPRNAYDAIAGVSGGLDPAGGQSLASRQQSVNDLVRGQMQRLLGHPRLSQSDRRRLQLHFDNIREIEVQTSCQMDQALEQQLDGVEAIYNSGDGDDVWAVTRVHMDIAVMAIACGYTRSVAIQVGNGNDGNNSYRDPDTGQLMENYHYISHRRLSHGDTGTPIPNSDLLHHKVDRQFGQAFKYLLDRLQEYQLPTGKSLLEHGVAIWYNDNGNGPGHSRTNIPFIIGGSADGLLKQGEYLQLPGGNGANHNQMLNTIATAVGVRGAGGGDLTDFGDSTLPQGTRSEVLV